MEVNRRERKNKVEVSELLKEFLWSFVQFDIF